jgi:hypothetical protein
MGGPVFNRSVEGVAAGTKVYGVRGRSDRENGVGVLGLGSFFGVSGRGENGLAGVNGESVNGWGVRGVSDKSEGVMGFSNSRSGVKGQSNSGSGVRGFSDSHDGVSGQSNSGVGVSGVSDSGDGVHGFANSGSGVGGRSPSGIGVRGESDTNAGVHAISNRIAGVGVRAWGLNDSTGVAAFSHGTAGIWLGGFSAGEFWGAVNINGNLTTSGTKSFKIDHPLDPSNKYLCHSSVESPDMKNVYDGVVVLDAKGEAVVVLAAWFEALNKEFRYQLTPISAPGPNLHIAEEIKNQRFKIAGGSPGMKVCWQVTGIRQDAWAQANPLVVEQDKLANERDFYLHPEAHGYPAQKSIVEARYAEELRQFREEQQKIT